MAPSKSKAAKHAYYELNKERIKARVRAYQRTHRSEISERNKAKRKANPEFYKQRSRKNYLKNRERILAACHAYHWRNREILLPKMRDAYQRDRVRRLAKQKRYHHANKPRMNALSRAAYWKNPEQRRASSLQYRKDNIEYIRAYDRERSKKRDPAWIRKFYADMRRAVLDVLGHRCVRCGYSEHQEVLQIDHKTPICKTGASREWSKMFREALEHPSRFQVFCPNHHAEKTYADLYGDAPLTPGRIEYRLRRVKVLTAFGSKCEKCGYGNIHALQFDHKKPLWNRKRKYPSTYEAGRWPHLFQLLCATCHTLKTFKDLRAKAKRCASAS